MGWSFRKSTSFGPFRLNFSKSGIGMSFGVKGARVSMNSRGTFVNLGANGIYYRQRIGGNSNASNNYLVPEPAPTPTYSTDHIHTITTENVENITDVDSQEFIKELESKANKISFLHLFGILPSVIIIICAIPFLTTIVETDKQYKKIFTIMHKSVHVRNGPSKDHSSIQMARQYNNYDIAAIDSSGWIKVFLDDIEKSQGFIRADMGKVREELVREIGVKRAESYPILKFVFLFIVMGLIAWCIYMNKQDRLRKTVEIQYTLDDELENLHQKFLTFFNEFASSNKIWQKLHTHSVSDQKYHAGASELVSRISIGGIYKHKLPSTFLKTNVSIPCIVLRNTEMYFFPERIILKRGNKFGAAFYKNINVTAYNVRFIEEGPVPNDAEVVDQTWKYLNKRGGPDRRFSNNRQLPICLYSEYSFESDNGIQEVITTSKNGGMDSFCEFIKVIRNFQRNLN